MKFKKQTADFCFEAIQNKDNIPSEILAYLKDWLTNHILKSDMQYKTFLDEQGKKQLKYLLSIQAADTDGVKDIGFINFYQVFSQ